MAIAEGRALPSWSRSRWTWRARDVRVHRPEQEIVTETTNSAVCP